jgi:hypothetical protein
MGVLCRAFQLESLGDFSKMVPESGPGLVIEHTAFVNRRWNKLKKMVKKRRWFNASIFQVFFGQIFYEICLHQTTKFAK